MKKVPRFHPNQQVSFVGGKGIVRSSSSDSGNWSYVIEMPLGAEPTFGRVGAETMIVLHEADLREA
jgi:hypothetical protein